MHTNDTKRKVEEFCKLGNLVGYIEELEKIFTEIKGANCNISSRTNGEPSVHTFPDRTGKCKIWISLRREYSEPIEIIWTILHEFGHHVSGPISLEDRNDINARIDSEEKAWDFAKRELSKYPNLQRQISSFDNYSKKCLDGYYKLGREYSE